MPNIGATELIIIAVLLVVLFGAAKLPTFARSVGRSMRIFKSEVKGMQDDNAAEENAPHAAEQREQPKELPEAKAAQPEATAQQHTAEQR